MPDDLESTVTPTRKEMLAHWRHSVEESDIE